VRRDHHRHAALGELADHGQHLTDELGVERARDLVEQQQARLHGERTGDRRALLLAARQAVRIFADLVGDTEAVEQLLRALLGLVVAAMRRRSRSISQSVVRASGIVMAMKSRAAIV
jgi:hypothetical protein